MSVNLIRMRFAAVAAKIETTAGTDAIAGTPAAADWLAGDTQIDFDPILVDNPEQTGSLDRAPSIVGGLRPRIRIRVPLRGSGAVGTAPDWGKLLRVCTMAETTNAAVGVPDALPASGHTATQVTLPTSPFGNTLQQYRGQPLLLSGAVVETTGIWDYGGLSARIARLGTTLPSVPTNTTLAQVPAHILYSPTSDETVYRTSTLYFFADGIRWRFTGAVGTWSLELTTGGIGFLNFDLRAQMLDKTLTALPTGWNTAIRPTSPRFVAGRCQLNNTIARSRRLMVDAGVSVVLPDNPEATEGYDPAVPIERDVRGSVDPLMDTTTTLALWNAFRAGTPMPLMAIIGSTAGNRFLLVAPQVRATAMTPGDRDGLGQHGISFMMDGADFPVFLSQF